MPVYRLSQEIIFPPATEAEADGLLAVGGDLSPERILLAYASGIFPWPHSGYPLLWFSPDPRMVLPTGELHVGRRLERTLRQGRFELHLDRACPEVIRRCASIPRRHECGTWITPEMIEAYSRLHELGFVHSAEAYRGGRLVGGIYGISLGAAFIGESMFAQERDASKAALASLVRQLHRWGITLFDAQIHTPHMEHFGAREWSRRRYLAALAEALEQPTRRGHWRFDGEDQGTH